MSRVEKCELLAPAGSFAAAMAAFDAGADAVYLGLKSFSARSAAANFGLDELRRLKTHALGQNRRIYVTLNTIIAEAEIPDMIEQLMELQIIGIDGVIIQDLGLLALIRAHFPQLKIHASTQMAVHNEPAVRLLKHLGVSRFVLARELGIKAISKLRESHPDAELEVFCHGALCYSFSGLCLASGLMLQRSANRGRCGQLCRSYYTKAESGVDGYYFAMKDLALSEKVRDLCQMGVSSLKIEGRMKSPVYVARAVALYRQLLDSENLEHDAKLVNAKQTALQLSFARPYTAGYFHEVHGADLINVQYPAHLGIFLGNIQKVQHHQMTLQVSQPLNLYDKLVFLPVESLVAVTTPRAGFIVAMCDSSGKAIKAAASGSLITLTIEGSAGQLGDQVYLVSKGGESGPKSVDVGRYPRYKTPLVMAFHLTDDKLTITTEILGLPHAASYHINLTVGERSGIFQESLTRMFGKSDTSRFGAGQLTINNQSQTAHPFIPQSALKLIKNQFYASCEEFYAKGKQQKVASASCPPPLAVQLSEGVDIEPAAFSRRGALNPRTAEHDRLIPFILEGNEPQFDDLAQVAGYRLLPLVPVVEDPPRYFGKIAALIAAHPHTPFLIGINNVGHIAPYVEHFGDEPQVSCFLDVFSYVGNRWTLTFFAEQLPRLLFYYQWVEKESHFAGGAGEPSMLDHIKGIAISDPESLPLFTSHACYKRHHQHHGECPARCHKRGQYHLNNQAQRYVVIVQNCLTFLFAVNTTPRHGGGPLISS